MKTKLIVVVLLGLAIGVFAEECASNHEDVVKDLETCAVSFNAEVDKTINMMSSGSSAFEEACGVYIDAINTFQSCFEVAIHDHSCTPEATYEHIEAVKKLEMFYTDTCANRNFDSSIFDKCDDPVKEFRGLADCFVDHLYDYKSPEFDEAGNLVDSSIEESECDDTYIYFEETASCTEDFIKDAGCSAAVADSIERLIRSISTEVINICGGDFLDDWDIEGPETTTDSVSDASIVFLSKASMMVTPLAVISIKAW